VAVTNYISFGGMLIGEETNGVMRNYGTDALGSVVATYSNGVPENTYAYKPYGATLAKTGTASDPSFLWNGKSGYRSLEVAVNEYYVRARHYSPATGQWHSVDKYWPMLAPYTYADANPTLKADPSGEATCKYSILVVDLSCQINSEYPPPYSYHKAVQFSCLTSSCPKYYLDMEDCKAGILVKGMSVSGVNCGPQTVDPGTIYQFPATCQDLFDPFCDLCVSLIYNVPVPTFGDILSCLNVNFGLPSSTHLCIPHVSAGTPIQCSIDAARQTTLVELGSISGSGSGAS
jgi:RHS repeat-associated protein